MRLRSDTSSRVRPVARRARRTSEIVSVGSGSTWTAAGSGAGSSSGAAIDATALFQDSYSSRATERTSGAAKRPTAASNSSSDVKGGRSSVRSARAIAMRSPPGARNSGAASKPCSRSSRRCAASATGGPSVFIGPSARTSPSGVSRMTFAEGTPLRRPSRRWAQISATMAAASAGRRRTPACTSSVKDTRVGIAPRHVRVSFQPAHWSAHRRTSLKIRGVMRSARFFRGSRLSDRVATRHPDDTIPVVRTIGR
jgi:hypothetical protein